MNNFLLLGTAGLLGFRHGIDWDHIAAIMDIVGSVPTTDGGVARIQVRSVQLSVMYAVGHASVVAILGMAALLFGAVLPAWIDPLMERCVGVTLVVLALWLFYSLTRHLLFAENFQLKSRWMIMFALVEKIYRRIAAWLYAGKQTEPTEIRNYDSGTAFGVGVMHGIGAETGTQILLIAAVGGASSHGLGLSMLMSFLLGLLLSNTALALVGSAGFVSSARLRPLYISVGALTGIFSLIVGSFFAFGQSGVLPDLQKSFGG